MHHRSYQSILPTHNKLLQKRWDDTYYQEHRRRIKTANHMVATNAPKQHPHVVNKLKKQQRESERFEVVQRDNDTLMVHMSAIMEKGSYVDHRNDYKHWSLNYGKRVNEMQKIQKENIKMLGRIQSRPANYKVSEWLKDRTEKERLISMITAHPSAHHTQSARPSAVRERKAYSHSSLVPLQMENGSLATLDPSVTDTVESLERELEAARTEVDKSVIQKKDICVVKSMHKPPVLVIMVLEAYAILSKQKGKDLWHLGARSLAQHHLVGIDINSISLSVLKKLQFYIENPKINEDTLRPVSCCIVSVWKWIESVYHYGAVAHKYGIRAEEKGIRTPVQQESITAQPSSVVKEKKEKSFVSLELSETDTIESLEKELAIARNEVGNCLVCKNEVYEVKSMPNPPVLVKMVLEAYAILSKQKGKNLWYLGAKSLAQHHLVGIDINSISLSVLKKLQFYIENPKINEDTLRPVSCCIASVWKWIESVYHYGTVAHKYGIRAEEKKEKSFVSLELSETDTVESLEKELAIARNEVGNCLIHKNDISEVKSMSKPPALVKIVLEAYGILSKQKGENLWRLGLQALVQHNAASFELDNIPISALKKLRKYIEEQNIDHQELRKVSASIVSICKWVESVYHYGVVAHKLDQLNTNKYSKDTS